MEVVSAALADVVLVVEARIESGCMITVDMALEEGKKVAIIPGRITDPLSKGCNYLAQNGATIATCPQDIIDLLEECEE